MMKQSSSSSSHSLFSANQWKHVAAFYDLEGGGRRKSKLSTSHYLFNSILQYVQYVHNDTLHSICSSFRTFLYSFMFIFLYSNMFINIIFYTSIFLYPILWADILKLKCLLLDIVQITFTSEPTGLGTNNSSSANSIEEQYIVLLLGGGGINIT